MDLQEGATKGMRSSFHFAKVIDRDHRGQHPGFSFEIAGKEAAIVVPAAARF
jgi:hypothetical protein